MIEKYIAFCIENHNPCTIFFSNIPSYISHKGRITTLEYYNLRLKIIKPFVKLTTLP